MNKKVTFANATCKMQFLSYAFLYKKHIGTSAIIDPAIAKHNELRLVKAREPKIRSAEDFIGEKS